MEGYVDANSVSALDNLRTGVQESSMICLGDVSMSFLVVILYGKCSSK